MVSNAFTADYLYYYSEGTGTSQEAAVQNALRKAVWNCLCDFSELSLGSIIKNPDLINIDSIVNNYTIDSHADSIRFQLNSVKIYAELRVSSILSVLDKIRGKSIIDYNPKILVDITETGPNNSDSAYTFIKMLGNKILNKKMILFTRESFTKNFKKGKLPDTPILIKELFNAGIDFLITGTLKTGVPYEKEVYGTDQKRISCCSNLQLIDCSTGQQITSSSSCEDWGAQSDLIACEKCYQTLIENRKFTIIDTLDKFWNKAKHSIFPAFIEISELSENSINDIEKKIRNVPSILRINSIINDKQSSSINLLYRGSLLDLYNNIDEINGITVNFLSSDYLRITDAQNIHRSDAKHENAQQNNAEISDVGLRITDYFAPAIFPCAIHHYTKTPSGTISLKNLSKFPLTNVHCSMQIGNLSFPQDTILKLIPPEKTVVLPLNIRFNQNELLKINQETPSDITVKCKFTENNRSGIADFNLPVIIGGINDFDWKKPEMIASFITPEDDVIKKISRLAISSINFSYDSILPVIVNAAAVYECIRNTGIVYIKDVINHKNLDNIQFPFQTMSLGSGDCDDTSVLLASLLESIGIETSMLVSEDHILIMFNTGVFAKNAMSITYDSTQYVIHNNTLWIPIETTRFNSNSFLDAWKAGIDQYNLFKKYSFVSIIDIRKSWNQYPPANPSHIKIAIPEIPVNELNNNVLGIMDTLIKRKNVEQENKEKDCLSMIKKYPNKVNYSRLGAFYVHNGNIKKAYDYFYKAYCIDSLDPEIQINFANIRCLTEDKPEIEMLYQNAIKIKPDDCSYYLNQYLFYLKTGHSEKSFLALQNTLKNSNIAEIESLLGLAIENYSDEYVKGAESSADKNKISIQVIKNIIRKMGSSILGNKKKSGTNAILPVGTQFDMVEFSKLFWWYTH